jgi:predicted DNA-binding protein with PD1-like motif
MQIILETENKSIVRVDKAEDCVEVLKSLASEKNKSFTFSIIGACSLVDLAYYDLANRKYVNKVFDQDHIEIVSVAGNVAFVGETPLPHLHGVFSDESFQTFGGHINKLVISATGELVIDWLPEKINREYNEETGLKLLCLI